jgi:hypothetical protein
MSTTQQILLAEIRAFCAATGMAETTFGQKAVHEWTLVQRLAEGRSIELKTVDRVRKFIAENTPGCQPRRRCA